MISACRPGLTGWRADEEDRERRGADLLRRPRQKGLSPLHRQPGHRVSPTQEELYGDSQQLFTVFFSCNERELLCNQKSVLSILFCIISDVKVREEEQKRPAFISKIISVKPSLHTCVLSFRTLYCAKGNYDFGISRVIKSLEPYNKKVSHFSTNCISQIQKITETFGSPRLTTTSSPTAQFNVPDVWLAPSAYS